MWNQNSAKTLFVDYKKKTTYVHLLHALQCKWIRNKTTKRKTLCALWVSAGWSIISLIFSACVRCGVTACLLCATPLTGNDRADRTPQLCLSIRTCVFCALQMFKALHIKAGGCTASNQKSQSLSTSQRTGERRSPTNQITGAWGRSANSLDFDESITSLLALYIGHWIMQTCPFQWEKARQKNESLCPFSQQERNESER